jgi:hypothetical protein
MNDEIRPNDPSRPVAGWAFPAALILLLLTLALAVARLAPPSPAPESAPADQFSAGRARAVLADLAGDGAPHPVGSPAQARVRERVIAALRGMGYEVRVEQGPECQDAGLCAAVQNVVAELPGREPGAAVLLAAHYDSVEAGPGVSDDLAGVASVLEVARLLKAGPPLRNSVVFLLDEGEEGGLLGAREFAQNSPEAARVKAVVNLEARGTSGPSLMFETGPADAWLMPHFSVPHPRTSSLFSTVYQYLPNDTDFTVFKRRGLSGFNFAYIGDPAHYHTPLDNLANISLASLQHHGENALGVVRSLGNADLSRPHQGKAVFFDVFGFGLVWWPAGWSPILAAVALLLIIVAAVRLIRRRLVTGGEVARGVLAWLAVLVLAAALGFALTFVLRLAGGLRAPWPAHGNLMAAAFWLLALAIAVAAAGWFRRAGFFGLWTGAWLVWGLFGLVTAILLPGASYLFLVPALAAGLAGLALPGRPALAGIVPAVVAGALWFPILAFLYDGLGSGALFIIGTLVAIALTPLLPLAADAGRWRRWVPAGALGLALVLCAAAVALPAFGRDSTRRLNITFLQDAGTKEARWVMGGGQPLPPPVRQAADFKPGAPFPWAPQFRQAYLALAPVQDLAGPGLTVVRDETTGGKRHLVLHLTSPRGAAAAFAFPPDTAGVESAIVGGEKVEPLRPAPGRKTWNLGSLTLPPQGIDIDVVLSATSPQTWYVADRTPGLPAAGAALARSRPDWTSTGQEGDVTMVIRKAVL